VQDESDYLHSLSEKLQWHMAAIMSNYDAGTTNDLSGQCAAACSGGSTKYSNLRWVSNDSLIVEPELVIEGVAASLTECSEDACSACHIGHMSDKPDQKFPVCTDYTVYQYTNFCNPDKLDLSKCGSDDYCFRSWPHGDAQRWKSDDADCRPLPGRLINGDFTFANSNATSMRKGLCPLGCDT